MFVSSYSTYVAPSSSDKTAKVTQERERESKSSFSSKLLTASRNSLSIADNQNIDYVRNSKTMGNKQELDFQQQNLQNKEKGSLKELTNIFSKQNTLNTAKSAYVNNSQKFLILQEPKATLAQTITSDKRQTQDIQELQEKNLRNTMVNTYQANDKYFQITA